MPVTPQWLPVEDAFERQLVERLVAEGEPSSRGFATTCSAISALATATLTDMGSPGPLLFIVPRGLDGTTEPDGLPDVIARGEAAAWTWRPGSEGMPRLPSPTNYAASRSPLASALAN